MSTDTTEQIDTTAVLESVANEQRMAAITNMWDSTVVPEEPEGLAGDLSVEHLAYIEKLQSTIVELAASANRFEGAAQSLAQALVRQTKIIAKLRTDALNLKLKLKDMALPAVVE